MSRESSSSLTEAPTPTPAPAPALTNAIRVSSLVFSWSNNSYVSQIQSSIALKVLIKSTTLIPLHIRISTLIRSMLLLPLVAVSWPAWLVEGGVSALLQDWAGSLSYKEKKRPVIYNTWLYSTSNTHSHKPELLPREDFHYHWQTGRLSYSS